jgi:N-acetylmuramoyl-L-alanine amidase
VSAAARLGLALALPALLGAARPEGLGDVTAVRHWSYEGYTRVVIQTSSRVRTKVERLAADPAAGRPERLFVDLGGVWVGTRYPAPIPVSDGLLQAVRVGQNTLSAARVVLDLDRYQRHRLLHLSGPPRVVIDVFGPRPADAPAPGRAFAARPGSRRGAGPPRGAPRLAADLRGVRTVVVDPGHGGSDPGAMGIGGLREKLVTLRIARALRPKLEAQGLRVVLTREGDDTLSLEERTAIAEGVGGDLFLSIHANAAPRAQLQGIETYYLDKSHERHTLRVAAHENGVAAAELDPLQRTLASFRVSQSSEQSALLAAAVQAELVRGLRGRFGGGVRDLGVKTGPFYVLFLSSMPSILVEAGFLTHREEARRLGSPAYAEVVAERIARGVARYRERRQTLLAGRLP